MDKLPPSIPLLLFGFALIATGIVLLILSYGRGRIESGGLGILFIGPIPIIFGGGGRRWLLITILAAILFLLILAASMGGHIVGW
ncbi:hypothetical protein DRO24_03715 [Candidatus Bathyarchaeota archaeon]|nr:MAG: hypothetical protein DRO24_03715 [Candidatus Bathyarchaeota archaeon]